VGEVDGYSSCPKWQIIALTKSMALAYGPSGVRVNCICPGDVNTPMVAAYFDNAPDPAALRSEVNSKYALRRIAEPEEIDRSRCFSGIAGGVVHDWQHTCCRRRPYFKMLLIDR